MPLKVIDKEAEMNVPRSLDVSRYGCGAPCLESQVPWLSKSIYEGNPFWMHIGTWLIERRRRKARRGGHDIRRPVQT